MTKYSSITIPLKDLNTYLATLTYTTSNWTEIVTTSIHEDMVTLVYRQFDISVDSTTQST